MKIEFCIFDAGSAAGPERILIGRYQISVTQSMGNWPVGRTTDSEQPRGKPRTHFDIAIRILASLIHGLAIYSSRCKSPSEQRCCLLLFSRLETIDGAGYSGPAQFVTSMRKIDVKMPTEYTRHSILVKVGLCICELSKTCKFSNFLFLN